MHIKDGKWPTDGWNLGEETAIGEGDVDWDKYLKALQEIGYDGFLTIERECGEDPASDIDKATTFLKAKLQ